VIARLDGTLIERDPPHLVIDCGGVGYEVTCSSYTFAGLPADGERVTLRVFTHATETKLSLFGFLDAQERAMFDLLIKCKNVGPSTAIAILSGSTPRDLVGLIAREEVPALTRIKGIGKKTAEMLVVELKDRCAELQISWDASGGLRAVARPAGSVAGPRRHPLVDEVMGALVGMGWRPQEAEAAIGELAVPPGATIEQLLRDALRSMPR
jgi:holliday junction DNA helicase RuvA